MKISDEQIIYFDNNSTTKTDDRVIDVMVPIMKGFYANPSSSHSFGKNVKKLIVEARDHVSNLINCKPEEIIFTSGSTESINLAIRGLAASNSKKRIVTISTEHKAVLDSYKHDWPLIKSLLNLNDDPEKNPPYLKKYKNIFKTFNENIK